MFLKKTGTTINFFFSMMIMSAMLLSIPLNAQQLPAGQQTQPADFSDEELVTFINAAQRVMPLQQESQLKMIEKIEDEDLTVDQFNTIIESFSTGEEVDATDAEIESFNNAMESIQEVQMQLETAITETISEEGMTPAMYEQIMAVYQEDPELQMRVSMLMEEMQDQD